MTPKEKAKELVDRMLNSQSHTCELYDAKLCAIIAVDELLSNIEPSVSMDIISARIKYWEQVKEEINNL